MRHAARYKTFQTSLEEGVLDEETDHNVRVDVGGRAPVLKVSLIGQLDRERDTDGGTTIGNSEPEGIDVARLVGTGKALFVAASVLGDVLRVALRQPLDGSLNGLHSPIATHRLRGVVGVGTSSIPVSLDGLRVEGGDDSKLLPEAVEQPPGDHDHITGLQGTGRSNLELPLSRHHLGVNSRDGEAGLDACIHVGLSELTPVDGLVTDSAVERSLRGGVSAERPSVRGGSSFGKHRVLLLESEQRLLGLHCVVDDGLEHRPGVRDVGLASRVQDVAHDEHIISSTDGIRADEARAQDAVRVVSLGLAGGRPIEGPRREVGSVHRGDGLRDALGLGPHLVEDHSLLRLALVTIVPDVLSPLRKRVHADDDGAALTGDRGGARDLAGRERGLRAKSCSNHIDTVQNLRCGGR
mmetsp:Transcript_11769/g.33195  ORF Transcript_11769/g.33195 Transcript_11769/m.33195 type:complete len:410 (+) Transcript_11769:478-1707(+)